MPRSLLFRTRTCYQKLDDRIHLLSNPPQSVKPDVVELWKKMNSESRHHPQPHHHQSRLFRGVSSSKHFLTWSATAANHKIQKLSKHFAQNVSRLGVKVDKVFHPHQAQSPHPSPNPATHSPSDHQSSSAQHDHLLSVNNVHVAVVHNLKSIPRGHSLRSNKSRPHQDEGSTFTRSRQKFDGELLGRNRKLGKSCEVFDIFELTPLTSGHVDGGHPPGEDLDRSVSSGISYGASTVRPLSPHWSRAGSLSSSGGGDTILLPDEQELGSVRKSSISLTNVSGSTGNLRANSELSVKILEEEPELRLASWFHAGIPREIALEVLKGEALGSFLVRESSSRPGCFALSLRVPPEFQPSGIAHYLILRRSPGGYKIKGFTKEFGTLTSLITHHSVMPELLPCPLFRLSPPPSRVSRANSSDFMEPEKLLSPQHHWKYITEF